MDDPLDCHLVGMDVGAITEEIDTTLRRLGSPQRAEPERAYLKSGLRHYGVSVPAIRKVAKDLAASLPQLDKDDLVRLVERLWQGNVHERRMLAIELLDVRRDLLGPADIELLERLLREARTWALVDGLAASVVGDLVDRYPKLGDALDRWAADEDFWIRRAALLALLVALRRGDGDFERFGRYANAMLEDREFFVRKAIGWVLRDTARKRPDLVFTWLLPRAHRASAVTIREAVKPLAPDQRAAIEARRR